MTHQRTIRPESIAWSYCFGLFCLNFFLNRFNDHGIITQKRGAMKKYTTLSMVLIFSFMLLNCATVKRFPLSKDAALNLKGKSCEISRHETPGFEASTSFTDTYIIRLNRKFFPTALSEGREIVAKNNIEDPAVYISRELAKTLNENLSIKILPESSAICTDSKVATICSTYKSGDIILDVRTLYWHFARYPTAWTKYRVFYAANFRIIDTRTKEVLADEFFSKRTDEDTSVAPTYDDLLNNNAERLKFEIRKLADEAISHFRQKGLNI
jgi:hypothetical protein